MNTASSTLKSCNLRPLVFVHGKGGVGKTSVSRALAQGIAARAHGQKILWLTLEDPLYPVGRVGQIDDQLWHLNADFSESFEEYAALKIGLAPLTRIFLKNKLIRYLAQAAPGIHELVLLGKIWHERLKYDHVIVDLPSTGYGLAMFQSTQNFVRLFQGGPLNKDAQEMLSTFGSATDTGHLIVSLPEEMPLRESLELGEFLIKMFPHNPPSYLINRLFPGKGISTNLDAPHSLSAPPLAATGEEFANQRVSLERYNLRLFIEKQIPYGELEYVDFESGSDEAENLVKQLSNEMKEKGYL